MHERRIQKHHSSFVLTIPPEMIEKYLKVRDGQSVKFYGYPDKVVLVAANRDADPEPDKVSRYAAEVERMMASDNEKGPGDKKAGATTKKTISAASRLEKLRIK